MSGLGGWLWLAGGGAVGTLLRYTLGGWIARNTGGTFPWETCVINVAGSLAIGIVAGYADRGGFLSPVHRMALMAGVLGGFTTYSSFALETLRLAADAQWIQAAGYVGLTNAGALIAVWGGYRLTHLL